jgi:hypothetical protein
LAKKKDPAVVKCRLSEATSYKNLEREMVALLQLVCVVDRSGYSEFDPPGLPQTKAELLLRDFASYNPASRISPQRS